jgi:TusA-related sulfurtransferase
MRKEIDAKGLRCPKPIIELAKARRSMKSGDEIIVVADDPAFESDLEAWCDAADFELESMDKEGQVVTARLKFK